MLADEADSDEELRSSNFFRDAGVNEAKLLVDENFGFFGFSKTLFFINRDQVATLTPI